MRTFIPARSVRARGALVGLVAATLAATGTTTAGAVVVPAQSSDDPPQTVVDVRSEDLHSTSDEGGCHIGKDIWEHCVYYQEGEQSFSRVVRDRRPTAGKDGALRMATPEPEGEILLRYSAHDDGREYPPFRELDRVSVALAVRGGGSLDISLRVDCTPDVTTDDAGLYLTYAGPTPAVGSGWTTVDLYDDRRALWDGGTVGPRPLAEHQVACPEGRITGHDLDLHTQGADVRVDRLTIGHRVVNFWVPFVSRVEWGRIPKRASLDREDLNRQTALARRQFVAYPSTGYEGIDPGRLRLPQSNGAVIVPQNVPFHALVGGPLANALGGPLLVNPPKELRWPISWTMSSTVRHGSTVYLVGNTRQLSPKVAAELREDGYKTVRIGARSPFSTAAAVARHIDRLRPKQRRMVVLASTTRFRHSLSASAAAGSVRGAVLLTRGDTLPPATRRYLAGRPVSRFAVGPDAAAAVPGLAASRKLIGPNPYTTAARVAERFFPRPRAAMFAPAGRPVAALLAGAHGGLQRQPLLVVRTHGVPPVVLRYLRPRRDRMQDSLVVAGDRTVSDATVARLHRVLRAR